MRTLLRFTGCAILLAAWLTSAGQNTILPVGDPSYEVLDRQLILSGTPEYLHPSVKPYRRGDVVSFAHGALTDNYIPEDGPEILRILQSNNEFVDSATVEDHGLKSKNQFLKVFYRTPAHFYEVNTDGFYLRVNPMVHIGAGHESDDDDPLFVNQRGIEIRGGIDKKIFFSSNIIETQLRPASHIRRFVNRFDAVPDAGLFKNYRSSFLDFDNAYDYLNSNGYIGFNVTEHVGIQIGHGKNMIGDGYRSLFLSDFAKNYFYLKFNTRIWKFHYQNIFAELSATERLSSLDPFPKKYLAAHYLSLRLKDNLHLGLYEGVVVSRDGKRFDLQYLNPVILYRTIEQHVGSPDNVVLGMNARWDIARRVSLYGQILFDEFKVSEFFSSENWWGNKYGLQLGAKYVNAFNARALDVQVEYNRVRPFTYSHYDSLGSYSHFNQPLAHPLGANFNELITILTYRPIDRLQLQMRIFLINTAEDTENTYFGTDILRSNTLRNADYGVELGQGVPVDNSIVVLQARYLLKHSLYIEAQYFRRDYDAATDTSDLLTQFLSIGLRWNLYDRTPEF